MKMQSSRFLYVKKIRCFAIMLIIAVTAGNVYAAPTPSVKTSLTLQNPLINENEPVFLNFTITNDSNEDIEADLGFNKTGNFMFSIVEPSGSKQSDLALSQEGFGRVGKVLVSKNSSYNQQLLLNEWYQFVAPGKYIIIPKLTVTLKAKSNNSLKTSPIETLILDILPKNAEKLKTVYQELLDKINTGQNATVELDAIKALSLANEPLIIPYLKQILNKSNNFIEYPIQGLERIGSREAIDVLLDKFKTGNSESKAMVKAALVNIKTKITDPELKKLISDAVKDG
ncbi:hypothetical protein [Methylomonas sp. AM2-LC]|uniref:HEAT repeat domain-containing protein n=1 Tax=Methylomonas sp. AM2-LC TaxID=3153301 RepID=UPI003264F107